MKYYIVKWKDKEHHFTDVKESIICVENVAEQEKCSSYVYVEENGTLAEEPFFSCELEY